MNRRNFVSAATTAAVWVGGATFAAGAASAGESNGRPAPGEQSNRSAVPAGRSNGYAQANGPGLYRDTVTDDAAAALRYVTERRFLDTSFGRIAYIDRGVGRTTLFLHGFPLNNFQWRGAIDRLCGTRRCIAPDFMGLGYTEVADGQSVTPAAQANMIATFLDRLNVDQVDLVANDSGGAVAQLFLVAHPGRVRTLLLTNCDVETDSPPPAVLPIIESARAGVYPDLYLEPWLRHKDVARSAGGLGGLCYSRPECLSDTAIEQYLLPLVATPARRALVSRYALGLTPNPLQGISAQLKKSAIPTRIVWGMSDTIFSGKSPDYLAGILPRVMGVRRLHEAKLFFPEEYPEVIAEEAQQLQHATELPEHS